MKVDLSNNEISFKVKDVVFGEELSLSNISLPLLREFVEQVSTFLKGNTRRSLGEIKSTIKEGSLVVGAIDSTGTFQDVFRDIVAINQESSINNIDPVRARVIEQWQKAAQDHESRTYEMVWDKQKRAEVIRISQNTTFKVLRDVWVDVEMYLNGRVFDLGGKNKPNVHVELENGKTVTISAKASILSSDDENRLYKDQLVRITAKQNIKTKELKDEKLISFENYNQSFDEEQFEKIAKKASIAWSEIDNPTKWVEEMRGNSAE